MELLNVVMGSVAAAAVPAFLLLYFLKRRHEIVTVPSTKLWREALSALHADRPWQRLRTNLLFFLQLAAIAALVFSAFRPVTRSTLPQEMVVVIDCSGSMQATDASPSRFEQARAEAAGILAALPAGGRITLIAAGAQPKVLLSRTADRIEARRALDALKPENGASAMDEAIQLAQALRRETGAGVAVLTDRYSGGSTITINGGGANRAVETLTVSRVQGELQALSVIRSHGWEGAVTAECRADGHLVDAREVDLPLDGTAVVYWTSLPQDAKWLNVSLTGTDALALDDAANCVVTSGSVKKVLLVSNRNVFLEAVLKLREDIELYKLAPGEMAGLSGYDLYVFDGRLPETMPADGSIIAFNPSGGLPGLQAGEGTGGSLSAATGAVPQSLLLNVNVGNIQLAKSHLLELTTDWQPLAWLGDKPAIATSEQAGRRTAVFGFDLHESNLPLLKEFPILMQNLLSWLLSDATGGVTEVKAGGTVPLLPHALAAKIEIVTPSGKAMLAAPPFPAAAFTDTDELGLYEVRQFGGDDKEISLSRSRFAVNAQTATESDLRAINPLPAMADGGNAAAQAAAAVNWWLVAAAAALALVMAEWLVSRNVR